MRYWTVVRRWNSVEAESAAEAIDAAEVGGHDDLRVLPSDPKQGFASFDFTREEVETLRGAVANIILQTEANVALVHPGGPADKSMREQIALLSSLQTELADARWELMTPDERREEATAGEEA